MIQKLSIIVPAFNEEKTIKEVLRILCDLELVNQVEKELIVINDYSSDNTRKLVEEFIANNPSQDIQLINQEVNQGKGAALHLGIKNASGEYLIPQDADLELDPKDINKLLEKAIKEEIDVVYGSRFLNGRNQSGLGWYANLFLTKLTNLLSGLKLSDMECCYKLIRSNIAKELDLKEKRFGFEPEITMKLAKVKGISFDEVPIYYQERTYAEGKKIGWKDGFRAIYCLIKYI